MTNEETIELLRVVISRAQWMREEGESDMRSIIYMVSGLISELQKGKSVNEILAEYKEDEE